MQENNYSGLLGQLTALFCDNQKIENFKEFNITDRIKGRVSVDGNIDSSKQSAHMTIGFKATEL